MKEAAVTDQGGAAANERDSVRCSRLLGDLRWTAEQPKRPGWWWVEIAAAKYVCELKIHTDGSLRVYNIWAYGAHVGAYAGCRWAGPLPEPQDAPDEESSPNARLSDAPEETSR